MEPTEETNLESSASASPYPSCYLTAHRVKDSSRQVELARRALARWQQRSPEEIANWEHDLLMKQRKFRPYRLSIHILNGVPWLLSLTRLARYQDPALVL